MLAVVLSGGGAKGAYEVGVWKALRKMHIKYDIITGTSIGALNGMMMTQNEFYRCIRLWKNINYDVLYDDFKKITSSKEMYLEYLNKIFDGGIDTNKIEQIINEHYKPNKLYNSKIGFGVVSFNLSTRKVVYSTKKNTRPDKLKKYILASATCFPFFKPTKIGTDVLVDGGYYDNLPINLAVELGATEIIAVDLRAVGIRQKIRNKEVKITYISPNNKLDSFLMFDSNVTKRMIKLGYNDTLKKFNKLEGDLYTFKRGTIDNLYFRCINKINDLSKKLDYIGNFKNLKQKNFYKIIEDSLEIFDIAIDKIYNSNEVNKQLFMKLELTDEINFDKFNIDELKKILNREVIAKYIYLKLKKCDKINPIFTFFPKEYTTAIYLLAVGGNL